jgi:hypothetical protein
VASALAQRKLTWLPILDYPAVWASSDGDNHLALPANYAYYAEFAAAFARRYGRGGTFWGSHPRLPAEPVTAYEIYNEPDLNQGLLSPLPDPDGYGSLYLGARAALHAVDPHADVLVGGLSFGGSIFVEAMVAAHPELARQLDAVAIHPYGGFPEATIFNVATMRAMLDRLGAIDTPIDITEVGWSTRGPGAISDEQRVDYLWRTLVPLARSDCGVERIVPHTWMTNESAPYDPEQWFGLWNPDVTPTRSGIAYATLVSQLRGDPLAFKRASDPICARQPHVTIQSSSGGASKGRVCATLRATLDGTPLDGASVGVGLNGATPNTTSLTDVNGIGHACVRVAPASGASPLELTASVTRPDLALSGLARAPAGAG